MAIKSVAIFLTVCLVANLAQAADTETLDPALGTVFPADKVQEIFQRQVCLQVPDHVTGTWTPNAEQIHGLELRLPRALAKANPDWIKNIGLDFGRQYGGILIDGEQMIYINAFPKGLAVPHVKGMPASYTQPDWHKNAIGMCDSGGVFGAEYNITTKDFSISNLNL